MLLSKWLKKITYIIMVGLISVMGCTDVAPTNPYDPVTPESQQIKGSVTGSVALGDNDQSLQAFERSNVLLFDLAIPLEEAEECSADSAQAPRRSASVATRHQISLLQPPALMIPTLPSNCLAFRSHYQRMRSMTEGLWDPQGSNNRE